MTLEQIENKTVISVRVWNTLARHYGEKHNFSEEELLAAARFAEQKVFPALSKAAVPEILLAAKIVREG